MRKFAYTLVLALAFAAAGCSRAADDATTRLDSTRLPGFTIDLPAGEVVKTTNLPVAGVHKLVVPAPGSLPSQVAKQALGQPKGTRDLRVFWQATDNNSDDLPMFRQMFAQGLPLGMKPVELPGTDRILDVGGDDNAALALGMVMCDGGFLVSVIYGGPGSRRDEVESTARRMLASIRCDASTATLPSLRPALALPMGFGKVARVDDESYYTVEGDFLYLNTTAQDVTRSAPGLLERMLSALLSSSMNVPLEQILATRVPGAEPGMVLLRFDLPDEDKVFQLARYCPGLDVSLMVLIAPNDLSDERARMLASGVSCPTGTEAEPPTVDAAFGAACRAGDAAVCEQWRELAAQGEATGSGD